MISCWVANEPSLVIYFLIWIFVFITLIFFIKSYCLLKQKTENQRISDASKGVDFDVAESEANVISEAVQDGYQSQKKKVQQVQISIMAIPVVTCIIWLIYTVIQYLAQYFNNHKTPDELSRPRFYNGFLQSSQLSEE